MYGNFSVPLLFQLYYHIITKSGEALLANDEATCKRLLATADFVWQELSARTI